MFVDKSLSSFTKVKVFKKLKNNEVKGFRQKYLENRFY